MAISSERSEGEFGLSHHWLEGIAPRLAPRQLAGSVLPQNKEPPCPKLGGLKFFLYSPSYQADDPKQNQLEKGDLVTPKKLWASSSHLHALSCL